MFNEKKQTSGEQEMDALYEEMCPSYSLFLPKSKGMRLLIGLFVGLLIVVIIRKIFLGG